MKQKDEYFFLAALALVLQKLGIDESDVEMVAKEMYRIKKGESSDKQQTEGS